MMRDMLPRLFFTHFRETGFIAEVGNEIAGFLIGFLSQTYEKEAYIHFAGVNPDFRKRGIARSLYKHFFEVARAYGRDTVRCVTAPINRTSISFHMKMGFTVEEGDRCDNGISIFSHYDGHGEDRVLFVRHLNP